MFLFRYLMCAALLATFACGTEDEVPPIDIDTEPTSQQQALSAPCTTAWSASAVYVAGNTVSFAGNNYRANWWTQGDSPQSQSGPVGSGKPWLLVGACGGAAPAPAPKPGQPATPAPTTQPAPAAPSAPATPSTKVLYSIYKDVSISANWNNSVISTAVTGTLTPLLQVPTPTPAITWSFATGECGSENFGGISGQTLANANIASWAAAKKPYIISTGGAAGSFTCGSDAGFATFLDRYASPFMLGVDFDIEAGQTSEQIAALVARVKHAQAQSKYKALRFSFTIATLGGNALQSLGNVGVQVMQAIKEAGLQGYYINLMAMDYGSPTPVNCTQATDGSCAMGLSAVQAAINLHQAYNVPYAQIELTPMIGGNDTQGETFALADVDVVAAFAKRMGLGAVHFWALDRDRDCAPGYASPTCNSYGKAGNFGFTSRFAQGLQ